MDQSMVDVTEIPDVKTGDEVTLLGKDGDEVISADTLGDLSGRFSYEFLCEYQQACAKDLYPRWERVRRADIF